MTTIRDLAKLCGVSTATVSLVLNGKDEGRVAPATRAKVQQAARRKQYRFNSIARGLVENRTYRIGVVLWGVLSEHPIFGNFSLYDCLGLIAAKIHSSGYALELLQIDIGKSLQTITDELVSTRVDGFLFLGAFEPPLLTSLLETLKTKDRPAVAIGTTLSTNRHMWVWVDHSEFVRDAIRRFINLGHRQVAFLQTGFDYFHEMGIDAPPDVEKTEMFMKAMPEELGLPGPEWLYRPREGATFGILEMIERVRREHPDCRAFLLNDNFSADAVLAELRRTGLTPGRDCRVFGFGDTAIADACRPRLSHYSLQTGREVELAVAALLRWIKHPKGFTPVGCLLPPEFLERET